MKKAILISLTLLLGACSAKVQQPNAAGTPVATTTSSVRAAKAVPNVSLSDLDSATQVKFAELPKPVVVTFWASWCTTCRDEFPVWRNSKIAKSVIGINVQDASASNNLRIQARDLMKSNRTAFRSYVDDAEVLTSKLGIVGLPVSIVVDSAGNIVNRHDGSMSKQQLTAFIKQAAELRK